MASPVRGFRALRAARFLTSKTPNQAFEYKSLPPYTRRPSWAAGPRRQPCDRFDRQRKNAPTWQTWGVGERNGVIGLPVLYVASFGPV